MMAMSDHPAEAVVRDLIGRIVVFACPAELEPDPPRFVHVPVPPGEVNVSDTMLVNMRKATTAGFHVALHCVSQEDAAALALTLRLMAAPPASAAVN